MKLLIFFLPLAFMLFGCNKNLSDAHKSDECKQYYSFIESQWVQMESHYQLKDEPNYLELTEEALVVREKYFSQICLIGLPKNKIHSIFGKPSEEMFSKDNNVNTFTYCLDASCYKSLNFVLKDDLVIQAYPNPYERVREH